MSKKSKRKCKENQAIIERRKEIVNLLLDKIDHSLLTQTAFEGAYFSQLHRLACEIDAFVYQRQSMSYLCFPSKKQ